MGRTAGANAEQTRRRLLRSAADVFAARGYDGARVADIARRAGLSNSAMYAYFGSKVELLKGALHAHAPRRLAELLADDPRRPFTDLLLVSGRELRRRPDPEAYLAIEALVAARREPEVADAVRDHVVQRIDYLADLVRAGQARGQIDSDLSPDTVAHFCLALGFGSALLTPDLHDIDDEDWVSLLARLVSSIVPEADPTADPASISPSSHSITSPPEGTLS